MELDLYTRREMLDVLEQIHVPGDFLITTFFTDVEIHSTPEVLIDIVKGGRTMAPFVNPLREGKLVNRSGYASRYYKIPYIKLKRKCGAQEFLSRAPGKTEYAGSSVKERCDELMGKDLAEMDQMIFRREEWMAAQCIQTGKYTITGEGDEYEIDFGIPTSHLPVLGAGDRWDESTSDISDDLTTWADQIYYDSGLVATDAIMGSEASKAMLRNAEFKDSLDTRRMKLAEIDVKRLPKGVKYFGYHQESGLDLWGYTERYVDEEAGTSGDLIDPKKVSVIASAARMTRHYGPIQDRKAGTFVGTRFPKQWEQEDPSVVFTMLQSAPMAALHQPDGVVCAQVIA